MNPRSLDTQLGFVDHELRTRPQIFNQVMNAKSVRDAAAHFGLGYESPKGSETGVAENMHGWGSRLGRAVNFASIATGKPMADFAASGWRPTDAPAGAPTQVAQEGSFELGPPPAMPDVQEEQSPMMAASADAGGSYDSTDLTDLYDMPGSDGGEAPLEDPVSQKYAGVEQQRRMGLSKDPTEMNLADLFQNQNINLQKIGAAKIMQPMRKMSVG
jgi:hypothetical protein